MTTRIEINHIDTETRKVWGAGSVVFMRVRCDAPGCKEMSRADAADNEHDRFSEARARGAASMAGWKIGEYSDGKSDRCPTHGAPAPGRPGRA
jgi:hypothetical protein